MTETLETAGNLNGKAKDFFCPVNSYLIIL